MWPKKKKFVIIIAMFYFRVQNLNVLLLTASFRPLVCTHICMTSDIIIHEPTVLFRKGDKHEQQSNEIMGRTILSTKTPVIYL